MIKKLDLYLLKSFFITLLVVTVAIGLTIVVLNMVEELRDFIDHDVPIQSVLEYYFYFGGFVVKSFLPMFVMLSVLFTVSIMARKQEILAMKASGRSLYRIAAPFMVVTVFIAAGHFYYNEYVFPDANKRRLEIKQFTIERRSRTAHSQVRDIKRQIRPGSFYLLSNFNVDRKTGNGFKLYETESNQVQQIVTADRMVYIDHLWHAVNGVRRTFENGLSESFVEFDTLVIEDIKDKPDDLAKQLGKPADMSLDELKSYIDLMKRTGGKYTKESVDLKLKYAFPAASIIVVMMCIPFAANPRRGGIGVSFAAGALIALAYFVLFRIMQSAGYNGKIPADVAAWSVNGLFLIIGIIVMLRARK